MNNRQVGGSFEEKAAVYLVNQGYVIKERNYRCRQGEIDLIAMDGLFLVFVEVKYRKDVSKGDPAEAVGYYKQQHIRRTARYYLYERGYSEDRPCRFDVVSILGQEIRVITDAF